MAVDGAAEGFVTAMEASEDQAAQRAPLACHAACREAHGSAGGAHASRHESAVACEVACAVNLVRGVPHRAARGLWRWRWRDWLDENCSGLARSPVE
jgi:hypothetical protein